MMRTVAQTLDAPRDEVYLRKRERQRGEAQYERHGDQSELRVVQEAGLRFRVNLSDYLDTGLFLDHRVTRGLVRDQAEGKRVLNLFAYTGAFSVYAADRRCQIGDHGRPGLQTYLDWAATQLGELNDLKQGEAHFHCSSAKTARDYLERDCKRHEQLFDIAVR